MDEKHEYEECQYNQYVSAQLIGHGRTLTFPILQIQASCAGDERHHQGGKSEDCPRLMREQFRMDSEF